jgi:hypothetical protein
MLTFAVLDNNNKVINNIIADSLEIAQEATKSTCIEYTGRASYLSVWDGTAFIETTEEQQIIDVEEVTPTPALEG